MSSLKTKYPPGSLVRLELLYEWTRLGTQDYFLVRDSQTAMLLDIYESAHLTYLSKPPVSVIDIVVLIDEKKYLRRERSDSLCEHKLDCLSLVS